jgi:osmotically-inducible protein OsmY
VDWQFQRNAAFDALEGLLGVKGVINLIQVTPTEREVEPREVKKKIKAAFHCSAEVDAPHVDVEAEGGKLVLKGSVKSWAEREEAARTAWAVPGVREVDNEIAITA